MFNPMFSPMAPEVIDQGPEALRAIAQADTKALDAALEGLGAGDLAALWEAAEFLADACRAVSKNRSW
jgi:hypothetical protein